jgi:peptidyl-prolyl cis-trans isomerase D
MPDSVKVRHILIKTGEQGKITLADSIAKRRIDSIAAAIRGGADFNQMVIQYSDDQGSKDKGGEYEFSSSQFSGISKEFAEVAFYGFPGDNKTVKVENPSYSGYHYIEVLGQRGFEPAYKVAEFTKAIVPSDETLQRENGLASQFAAESRNRKSFDENAKKQKYNKLIATDIKPLDGMINGLGSSREVVKWIYGAKPGDVAEVPFQVEDKIVVPVVTKIYEKGLLTVDKARPMVESIIRNEEKAKLIASKIGKATTVEAAAQATGQPVVKTDSIVFGSTFIPNVGQEPKVIGASFYKAYQAKASEPITGNGGVFVLKINNISVVPDPAVNVPQQQKEMIETQQRAYTDPRIINEILKKTVKIKDERHKFF